MSYDPWVLRNTEHDSIVNSGSEDEMKQRRRELNTQYQTNAYVAEPRVKKEN